MERELANILMPKPLTFMCGAGDRGPKPLLVLGAPDQGCVSWIEGARMLVHGLLSLNLFFWIVRSLDHKHSPLDR